MASSAACGTEEQTVSHVVLQCPIHRPPHGLHGQTVLDDNTIEWLFNTCPRSSVAKQWLEQLAGKKKCCRVASTSSRRFLRGVGILTMLGVGVGFFCQTPTPEVQLNHLNHTPKLDIPAEMVQFHLNLLSIHNSFCVGRFPLFASCYKIVDS